MATFMACAHANFTGELGVCIATSGSGASHLITGLYDARMDLICVGPACRAGEDGMDDRSLTSGKHCTAIEDGVVEMRRHHQRTSKGIGYGVSGKE
jgi:glyoxylate carboligase